MKVAVIGEAIADFLPRDQSAALFDCALGGSGFNTTLALARLGVPVGFAWTLSRDALGQRFRQALESEGVDLAHLAACDAPTPVAIVQPAGASHGAMFALHLTGTAHEQPPSLAGLAASGARHLHAASFAATAGEAAGPTLALLEAFKARGGSSYDPNIRASCLPPRTGAVALVERRVAASVIAKASEEDLAWLYPGLAPHEALLRWLALGAAVAIVTRGAAGALAMTADAVAEAKAPEVALADAVGAGDTFTAGFLAAMDEEGALCEPGPAPDEAALRRRLEFAVRAASLTCARPGCDPPRRAEL